MTTAKDSSTHTADGLRKFRFGAGGEGNKDEGGARKFVKLAQTAEEYGYDTFAVPDHLGNQVGPLAALGALSQATSTIRLGTSVLANGFRHPAILAKEANTIDVLSKGRLELGIGAGWMKEEFDKAGIEFTTESEFKPNANRYSCAYCPYRPDRQGDCVYGHTPSSDLNKSSSPQTDFSKLKPLKLDIDEYKGRV